MAQILLSELLLEATSFPDERQLAAMKQVMDGESKFSKKDFKEGMKTAELKNIYELVLWGLRRGIIRDKPIELGNVKTSTFENYPIWLQVLNLTVAGYTDAEISLQGRVSPDSIKYYRKMVADKFGLGDSLAKYIRFGFAALNPIAPPDYVRGFKPFKPWTGSTKSLMPIKYRPAEFDPELHPVFPKPPTSPIDIPSDDVPTKPKAIKSKEKDLKPVVYGNIQLAFRILGVDLENAFTQHAKGPFWYRKPEYLWDILELAKKRYSYEIRHARAYGTDDENRAKQLNSAWDYIRRAFARRGFSIGG